MPSFPDAWGHLTARGFLAHRSGNEIDRRYRSDGSGD
jgi:hypothetical protein